MSSRVSPVERSSAGICRQVYTRGEGRFSARAAVSGIPVTKRRPAEPPEPPPPGSLVVERFERDGEEYAIFTWPVAAPETGPALTPALRDVLECIAAGMSNAEIARHRGTSPRTVANQVAALFEIYGVGSRVELARMT
jgi:DNA-binding CsgD family transcriptional regulator